MPGPALGLNLASRLEWESPSQPLARALPLLATESPERRRVRRERQQPEQPKGPSSLKPEPTPARSQEFGTPGLPASWYALRPSPSREPRRGSVRPLVQTWQISIRFSPKWKEPSGVGPASPPELPRPGWQRVFRATARDREPQLRR